MSARVLLVRVGDERVALPLGAVREVVDAPEVFAVPMAPETVCGHLMLRGQHMPVMNVARLLGIPRESEGVPVAVVLVDGSLALAVDDALDAVELPEAALRPAPNGAAQHEALRALVQLGATVALLVDAAALTRAAVASLRTSSPL
ncbi:MAG: hypothetical protein C0503_07275 [Gemmatimonas sp.]|nr:hypothetical protein [Gemmatimonas sp.]